MTQPLAVNQQPLEPPRGVRLLSLDAFRGLVIVVMFMVNVAGKDPAFPGWFPHVGWNNGNMGNGLADYVFPWFLFIVGAAVPFSMASGRGRLQSVPSRVLGAFRRALTIYFLGTIIWCASIGYGKVINANVLLHWDILPLIGFAYFVTVILCHLPRWMQVGFVVLVLVFKWLILTQLVVPGRDGVIWTAQESYQSYLRDLMGWWGTMVTQGLAAAATSVLGALAGSTLRDERFEPAKRASSLVIRGVLLTCAAWCWHEFGDMPLSKDFFTGSYILITAGTGLMILGIMYWLVDCTQKMRFTWLRILGMNAIAVYFLAEFLWKTVMMQWKVATPEGGSSVFIVATKAWCQSWVGVSGGSWLHLVLYVFMYWMVGYVLYRKGWFIKV